MTGGRFSCHIALRSDSDIFRYIARKANFAYCKLFIFIVCVYAKSFSDVFAARKYGSLTAKSLRCADSE